MDNPHFKLTKSNLPTPSTLTFSSLSHLSKLYDRVLIASPQHKRRKTSPAELQKLDNVRYNTIPHAVSERQVDGGDNLGGFLAKAELQDLVDWKLARGVYRPTLPSLIASNDPDSVVDITRNALDQYTADSAGTKTDSVEVVMKKLCELRGVGPATASLLLAVALASEVPFFSDELFYWTASGSDGVKLEKIKYNLKEYKQIVQVVSGIQTRLEKENAGQRPRADDIEKAAYVVQKLQNPDIWQAVFGSDVEAAERIANGGKEKNSKDKQDDIAKLDKAATPTEQRTDLNEEEKKEELAEKKEILLEHGAKVKGTGKKRSRDSQDQPAPRRSTRTKR